MKITETFDEYAVLASKYAVNRENTDRMVGRLGDMAPESKEWLEWMLNLTHSIAGLNAEAGEVSGVLAKYLRGDITRAEFYARIAGELGDTLYFWNDICDLLNFDRDVVATDNLIKLEDRWQRGVLRGDGDKR